MGNRGWPCAEREAVGWSRTELAKAAGIARETIRKWELGLTAAGRVGSVFAVRRALERRRREVAQDAADAS